MTYKEITGNIFNSKAEALVNTVNCVGVMGKGIALEFRRRYPAMFARYVIDCNAGKLKPGLVYPYKEGDLWILNFAIKGHWKFPSKIEWIESSLRRFKDGYQKNEIHSVAFPWMGAMNGGLPLEQIQEVMRRHLQDLPDLDVEIYSFDPNASDPLFEKLKAISKYKDPIKCFHTSTIQKSSVAAILGAVQNKVVTSLYGLEEQKIIGATTADKLYAFLTNIHIEINHPPSEKSTQLKLL